ncbi:MAG: hypothetical protein IPL94_09785 [Tetrasphaera sp.]|nr:hypothetical protein [Tetrasphaera sp.]
MRMTGSLFSLEIAGYRPLGNAVVSLSSQGTQLPTSGVISVGSQEAQMLNVSAPGLLCLIEGEVTIHELVFDASSQPSSFAADVAGTCNGYSITLQLRGQSTVEYGGLDFPRWELWSEPLFGTANDPRPVMVTGHGTKVPQIVTARIDPSPGDFVVMHGANTCAGRTLGHMESCSVTVACTPRDFLPESRLVVETQPAEATTSLHLSATGVRQNGTGQFFSRSGRVMDTRSGLGVRKGVVGPKGVVTLKVTGKNDIPTSGVSAAVFNVTVTGATASSFVTAYPAGATRPTASNINFPAGFTGSNLVTVPLGANGSASFFNNTGSTHLIADLVGIYSGVPILEVSELGADYTPTVPERVLDSRSDWGVRLGPGYYASIPLDYGSFSSDITAFVVNVTATGGTGSGFLSAVSFDPADSAPTTSTVNYVKGGTAATLTTVGSSLAYADDGSGPYPTFYVANSTSASVHVIVDVVGFYFREGAETGLRFRSLAPTRILDTRSDLAAAAIPTAPAAPAVITAPLSVAGWDTYALAGNLTGVAPSASTYLRMWGPDPMPGISNLNLAPGVTRANAAFSEVDNANVYRLINAKGTVEVLYDVSGTFELFPGSPQQLAGVPVPTSTSLLSRRSAASADLSQRAPLRLPQLKGTSLGAPRPLATP